MDVVVEPLEQRVLLDASGFDERKLFTAPGSADQDVRLTFEWTARQAKFNNELGYFSVDSTSADINGVNPGQSAYAQTAVESGVRETVFFSGQGRGARRDTVVRGGDLVHFYMVQDSSADAWLDRNATNHPGQRPLVYFADVTANSDGFDHVIVESIGTNRWRMRWEDQFAGGDRDFDDIVVEFSAEVLPTLSAVPGAVISVPGQSFETTPTTFKWVERNAAYRNELGIFPLDDATGRIGNLKPGHPGYANKALNRSGARTIFSSGQSAGAVTTVNLPGSSFWGMYLVQNATAQRFLQRNPTNDAGRSPNVFFSFPGANPGFTDHVRELPGGLLGWEDLTFGGDHDYNDLIACVQFGVPTGGPQTIPITVQAELTNDTAPGGTTNTDSVTSDAAVSGRVQTSADIVAFFASFDDRATADFVDVLADIGTGGEFAFDTNRLDQILGQQLQDGTHTLRLFARNDTGAESEIVGLTFTLDTQPPPLSLDLDASSDTGTLGDQITANATVTLAGQTEAGLTVTLDSAGATVTTDDGGRFSFSDVPLGIGVNQFSVRTFDIAGNETTFTEAFQRLAPPQLTPIGEQAATEHVALTFTVTATDIDTPADELVFTLDSNDTPSGAVLDSTTGQFSWTPGEGDGGALVTATILVQDNSNPALRDFERINIRVAEDNQTPVIDSIDDRTIDEHQQLVIDVNATDADLPQNTLSFSLDSAPSGTTIDVTTGTIQFDADESHGGQTFDVTVRVTDDGAGNLSSAESFAITVNETNERPILAAIGNQTGSEQQALTFTATATDADTPANDLLFSIDDNAPAGAVIDAQTGAFTWTPTEAQSPGTYPVIITVTDSGQPNLSDSESILLAIDEVIQVPTLNPIGNRSIAEGQTLTFSSTASDPNIPPVDITFSLDGNDTPNGAAINATTGEFTWTPTEAQGPGTFTATVRASNTHGSDSEQIVIDVAEVNTPPELQTIGNQSINESQTLTIDVNATDADLPANSLTFSLDANDRPVGSNIDAGTGAFTWTPTEGQGPGTYFATIRVRDNGSPSLSDSERIEITVSEVNQPPVLAMIGNRVVDEQTVLSFTATATDPDVPPNSLTFSLDPADTPVGASITSAGNFTWTPTENDGPQTFTTTVIVTDNGSPALTDSEQITISVGEVNRPPVLGTIANQTVNELTALSLTATATDPDRPPNTLTFSLDTDDTPSGALINPGTGVFTWTPSENQGPGVYTATVIVTDNGTPALADSQQFTIQVFEVNDTPVLGSIGDRNVDEGQPLSFIVTASDPDVPANQLAFSLDAGAPSGATINANTGAFTWTPTEADGPGTFDVTFRVTDNGNPARTHAEQIQITVAELNVAPVLAPIGNRVIDEQTTLSFTASATDSDTPANTLTFSLDANDAPVGAAITSNGNFTWIPAEGVGPGSVTTTVIVTDSGSPALTDSEQITISIGEVNQPPVLTNIANQTIDELTALTFTVTANDADQPPNTLSFAFDPDDQPAGATINASSGVFAWTPTEAQGPGTYTATVIVTDDGATVLSDSQQFTIQVLETNLDPVLTAIGNQTVNAGQLLTFTASASDPDVPANVTSQIPCGFGLA